MVSSVWEVPFGGGGGIGVWASNDKGRGVIYFPLDNIGLNLFSFRQYMAYIYLSE